MEIPVYLFTGFLEAGKTKFIQETLADEKFFQGKNRTLVLLFEEGEEELEPAAFASPDVFVEVLDDKAKLNPDKLDALRRKHNATRVIIEYNGMWLLSDLFNALPQGWMVYQEMMFADASTIEVFNANMRNLVVDKLNGCELVVFNRCTPYTDTMALHKLVRGVSRRTDIIYEHTDGSYAYDDFEDPLPFDVNAEEIVIEDTDYALWYRDLADSMENYDGKTVTFLGSVEKNDKLAGKGFVIGRQIMTCCADDIAYGGLLCEDGGELVKQGDWVRLTAKITVKNCKLYGRKGPVLSLLSVTPAEAPEELVVTFY